MPFSEFFIRTLTMPRELTVEKFSTMTLQLTFKKDLDPEL